MRQRISLPGGIAMRQQERGLPSLSSAEAVRWWRQGFLVGISVVNGNSLTGPSTWHVRVFA